MIENDDGGEGGKRSENGDGSLSAGRVLQTGDWLALRKLSYQQKDESCPGSGSGSASPLDERYAGFSRVGGADAGEQVEGKPCTRSGNSENRVYR
jgi:hypothetical protein